jgi:hypothetical protein
MSIDVDMTSQRTGGSVAGESAVRKAWGATDDVDSATLPSGICLLPGQHEPKTDANTDTASQTSNGAVTGEDAVQKARRTNTNPNSTTIVCSTVSTGPVNVEVTALRTRRSVAREGAVRKD